MGHGALHGPGSHQELAGAGLLHDLRPGEAEHLAEAFIAVDDPAVLNLGVGDQKLAIWWAERQSGSVLAAPDVHQMYVRLPASC